jgi:ABC transport system ATP-binding/permease protein
MPISRGQAPVLLVSNDLSISFGAHPLFENISISIAEEERLGLIGPNGSGKSTFLQILAGLRAPDTGTRSVRRGARVSYVPQEPGFPEAQTVRGVLEAALPADLLDAAERESLLNVTMGKAGFTDGGLAVSALSGGWKRRLSIARELMRAPDLLLLDEPTNHLDLEGILWLERLLDTAPFASIIVSHDRYFLENVVNAMAEINRVYPGGMFRAEGNYSTFLEKREEFLEAQSRRQEALANRVRREVEWLRRGPKARTGKSRARIDTATALIGELAELSGRSTKGTAQIDFTASDRKTRRLLAAEGIEKEMGGRALFRSLNLTLSPGIRLGLVGPNGSGKTTLLRILKGQLDPDAGTIERAENLRTVYFDQGREQLDPEAPLRFGLGAHGDTVIYRDRPIHVAGWARRFMFRPEQLDTPVGRFSGGERARILIARLMLQPADLLLLDEPTNDLDIPTLEVLEDSLLDFPGALVLVTHDRYLLDRVSTVVLGLDGAGAAEGFADYSQWEQFRQTSKASPKPAKAASSKPAAAAKKKLSYLESREWEQMEEKILAAEQEVESAKSALQAPDVVRDPLKMHQAYDRLKEAEADVERLFHRWAELEAKLQVSG